MSETETLKTIGTALGIVNAFSSRVLVGAQEYIQTRRKGYRMVCDQYEDVPRFSKRWFWVFLFLVSRSVEIVGSLVFVLALVLFLASVKLLPAWLGGDGGVELKTFVVLGVAGVFVAAIAYLVLRWEPGWSYSLFRHWLRRRDLERILANRIKTHGDEIDEAGIFSVDEIPCEKVGRGMAEWLAGHPDYLSGTLLENSPPQDPATLANELFVGELFESLMDEFDAEWTRFRCVQEIEENGEPLLSPANVRALKPEALVRRLLDELEQREGVTWFPDALRRGLERNLALLASKYQGSALGLFAMPPPIFSLALGALFVTVVAFSIPLLGTALQEGSLLVERFSLAGWMALWAVWLVFLIAFLRLAVRQWPALARSLRLMNGFEIVEHRLKDFAIYRGRWGARMALAKFAFEYGLLDIDPRELRLGRVGPVVLALLKTGCVKTDAERLSGGDEDLMRFAEEAMRRIAAHLEARLSELPGWSRPLEGEDDPYNMVDGFLFLVGYEHCAEHGCARTSGSTKKPPSSCPLFAAEVCDSARDKRFEYDREPPRQFVRRERP